MKPLRPERRSRLPTPRGWVLTIVVVLIFGAAAAGIVVLRFDAAEVRDTQSRLGQIQLDLTELSNVESESLSQGDISRSQSVRWFDQAGKVQAAIDELKPLAFEEIPSRKRDVRRLGILLRTYISAVREEILMIQSGESVSARRVDRQRTEPTFSALSTLVRETWNHLDRTAKRHHREADIGSLLALVAALGLAGLLLRKSGRAERDAELHDVEERSLRESRERFRALLQHASDTIVVAETDGVIRSMIGSVADLFGDEWESLSGTKIEALVHQDDRFLLTSFLASTARETGKEGSVELRMLSDGGEWRHVEILATNLLHVEHLHGIVLTMRDVTSRKVFEDQLRHKAFHDPLTQLPNRALFYDRVEHALAGEQNGDRLTAVLLLELSDFQAANKGLGHAGRCDLLVEIAGRLEARLSSADTAARLGTDEFAILIVGVGGSGEVVEVAERLLHSFEEPFVANGETVSLEPPSIGIAISTAGAAVETLMRNADLAMYSAKRNGKARYELFDRDLEESLVDAFDQAHTAMNGPEPDRIRRVLRGTEQREEILAVLERPGAIETVFQPIVDLRTGVTSGYEALSRFNVEPSRPPNAWFEVAHRSGLGPRLEAAALRLALGHAGRPEGTYLSVNLSPSALASAEVQELLPADMSELVIEITENELVTEREGVPFALALTRERGARLAVDDAGTGYAGLRQLMRLRPDIIKLDRSLIDGVHGDVAKTALVDSLVRYGYGIGASVCAEGIERLEDLRALADLDVTYGQGYGLARPGLPWPDVSADARAVCTQSLDAVIAHEDLRGARAGTSDLRLEQLSRRLFEANGFSELNEVMELVAAELHAEEAVCQILVDEGSYLETVASHGWQAAGDRCQLADLPATRAVLESEAALQVRISDSGADRAELERMVASGIKSLVKVPIVASKKTIGMLEACSHKERPWSRTEIHRARLISYQLGAVLDRFMRSGTDPRSRGVAQRRAFAGTGLGGIRERMKATSK